MVATVRLSFNGRFGILTEAPRAGGGEHGTQISYGNQTKTVDPKAAKN